MPELRLTCGFDDISGSAAGRTGYNIRSLALHLLSRIYFTRIELLCIFIYLQNILLICQAFTQKNNFFIILSLNIYKIIFLALYNLLTENSL